MGEILNYNSLLDNKNLNTSYCKKNVVYIDIAKNIWEDYERFSKRDYFLISNLLSECTQLGIEKEMLPAIRNRERNVTWFMCLW